MLLPDLVVGSYVKINLIGKPKIQSIDNLRYIALRYVGLSGISLKALEDVIY